jgi:hypothetical protein
MNNDDFVAINENEVIVVCPKCNVEYSVFERDLSRPRELKCAECGYSWLHNGIDSNKKNESSDLTNSKTSITDYEDDPRGDFDYPEEEDSDTEWLLNKDSKDLLSSQTEETNNKDLLAEFAKFDEIDNEVEVETHKENSEEGSNSQATPLYLDLSNNKEEDNSSLEEDKKDNLKDLFDELDDIDKEEDILIEAIDNNITNIISDSISHDNIKDNLVEGNNVQKEEIIASTQEENSTDINNNLEKPDEINMGLVKNDDLTEQKFSMEMDEIEDNYEDYNDEYDEEQQSLFSKVLNYGLIVVAPIVFIGFLLTTSLNFYNSMPNFVKYGLSIIGIQNLSGLRFINLKPHLVKTEDNGLNLVVEGTVANISDETRKAPKIQIKLFDKLGTEHEYETTLSKSSLKSMEYEKFTYRIFAIDFEPSKIDVSLINGINKYVKYRTDK